MQTPLLTLLISFLLPVQFVFASAAIQAKQRAVEQRRQQLIQQRQQAIAQQQAVQAQRQAYSQAVAQRQATIQQAQQRAASIAQQQALRQQAYNQAVTQQAINMGNAQRSAYENAKQALSNMQPPQAQYQQQMAQDGVLTSNQQPQNRMPYPQMNMPSVAAPGYGDMFYTPPVEEVVNITDIWKRMEDDSRTWALMIDMEPKILTVQRMIDHFKNNGVQINKDPSHYVQMIDSMAFQNPDLLNQPFENIMRVVAIIEYDFGNGMNKDKLARQVFPNDKQFKANKKRLGM